MNAINGGELAANAHRAIERYRAEERQLEAEIAERVTRLAMMREFIAALTAAPRPARKPRIETFLKEDLPEVEEAAKDGQP